MGAFGLAAVVAAAGAGIAVWAAAASGAIDYRIGSATTATVEKTLTVPGTAGPVDQATADFQVPGTVAAVDVTAGQSVTAGQTLASLDTATLQQAVTSAEINVSRGCGQTHRGRSGRVGVDHDHDHDHAHHGADHDHHDDSGEGEQHTRAGAAGGGERPTDR